MDNKLQKAVIKTLVYSDIFDYPLRISELYQYLIGLRIDKPSALSFLFNTDYHGEKKGLARSKNGLSRINERNGYFFLQGREKIVVLRQKREKISQEKMQRAKKVLGILQQVPFIKMVAVTGAVAAGNTDENSDIDVLVVTQKNRMWLARMLAILILEIKRVRRRPPSSRRTAGLRGIHPSNAHKNEVCLNMFISEDNLELPNKDLFTANEFVRMKVIWNKDQTYERFVKTNGWIDGFLPNWIAHSAKIPNSKSQAPNKSQISNSKHKTRKFVIWNFGFGAYLELARLDSARQGALCLVLNCVEKCARFVQLKYMERRKTTEFVTNGLLMFHPNDAREWVMEKYKKRLRELETRD